MQWRHRVYHHNNTPCINVHFFTVESRLICNLFNNYKSSFIFNLIVQFQMLFHCEVVDTYIHHYEVVFALYSISETSLATFSNHQSALSRSSRLHAVSAQSLCS